MCSSFCRAGILLNPRTTLLPLACAAIVFLLAGSASAELVKPNVRCGPPLKREQVKVLDVSELLPEQAADFVEEQAGDIEIVKQERVEPATIFGKPWKKAEKLAADLGCPYVIVMGVWEEPTAGMPSDIFDPTSPRIPLTKNVAEVLYAKPAQLGGEEGNAVTPPPAGLSGPPS
jgi:hypothetical protein